MRWASVDGSVRKACAISSVVRPQTSRRVSATRASGVRTGWQHVKMSRSRSSSMFSSSIVLGSALCAFSCSARFACEASKRARRRIASMALKRPVETSHARGFAGSPSFGHCSNAALKASCSASSATSKSPRRRIRLARIRRDCDRYTASTLPRISSAVFLRIERGSSSGSLDKEGVFSSFSTICLREFWTRSVGSRVSLSRSLLTTRRLFEENRVFLELIRSRAPECERTQVAIEQ